MNRLTRGVFAAGTFASIGILRFRAEAAEITWRYETS